MKDELKRLKQVLESNSKWLAFMKKLEDEVIKNSDMLKSQLRRANPKIKLWEKN